MKLFSIEAGNYKADAGACFGVVPKTIWQNYCEADENNLITISQRCLLIDNGKRIVLIDTGMGNKQSEKFYSFKYLTGNYSLLNSLKEAGYTPEQITDVIFTHLHYDHCGGALIKNDTDYEAVFKNAMHWCSLQQWQWANNPNPREGASYFNENYHPLLEKNMLKFITKEGEFSENISLRIFNGHTDGQIIPLIKYKNQIIVFMADFIPSAGHIPIPYIPSYDTRPLISMQEKESFLQEAYENNYILFFEHDAINECCTLKMTTKGIRYDEVLKLNDAYQKLINTYKLQNN